MTSFLTDAIAYDWLTIVGDNVDFYRHWQSAQKGHELPIRDGQRWLNRFDGTVVETERGSLFVGSMSQPVGHLFAAIITGSLADSYGRDGKLPDTLDMHGAWLTRVDLQLTLPHKDLPLISLFLRLEKAGKKPEIMGDEENGRSIYVGSQKSERRCNIYQKFSEPGENKKRETFLRVEFRFKGQQARSYGISLRSGTITPEASFLGALRQLGDKYLTAMYDRPGIDSQLPRVAKAETNTDKWLAETVYPVVLRRLHSHDCSTRVREIYGGIG